MTQWHPVLKAICDRDLEAAATAMVLADAELSTPGGPPEWPNLVVPDGKLAGSSALHIIAGQRPRVPPEWWPTWLGELCRQVDSEP